VASRYLSGLTDSERNDLALRLHEAQHGECFICGKTVDLDLQPWDIDHVEPLSGGGKDAPENFALTHSGCNRSKQAANLRVARVLAKFDQIRESVIDLGQNRPNLSDVLAAFGGAKHDVRVKVEDSMVTYSLQEDSSGNLYHVPLYTDSLSGMRYFFCELPISHLHHDSKINPRAIGGNLRQLVSEFYDKRPQLHVSLAWMQLEPGDHRARVQIFDGQHKAAAQVLLGVRRLPVRVFVNPDLDILLTTNTNAGTTLRQVAFDLSVQRYLGSEIYADRIRRYQLAHGKSESYYGFSEQDLVSFFAGEAKEIRRYVLDDVRNSVTHSAENRLREFIDFGGRGSEKPLSYSTLEKTVYSRFIGSNMLVTPLDYRLEAGDNPRQLEKEQLIRLLNIIADELFVGRFDLSVGTYRIERRIVQNEDADITDEHLRAFRLSREEILFNWLVFVEREIRHHFLTQRLGYTEDALFQVRFPEGLWESLTLLVRNLGKMPLWINRALSATVFGTKQNRTFWEVVFTTGQSPDGAKILPRPVDLNELIRA